ncbi:MAG TPA: hypothetical protein VF006_03500 [Longimicrobium sp.]
MRKPIRILLAAAALSAALSGTDAAAQGPRARVPALVAISPELQGTEAPFRLARFGGSAPRDVILLAPDADATVLTQAVEALLAVRRHSGDAATSDAMLRMREHPRARVLPWATRVLQDVRTAAPRQIPGVGRLRAVQIWLPAQRRAPSRTGS